MSPGGFSSPELVPDNDGSMELSQFTDYSLRTLIYAGLHGGRNITVPEVAQAYGISQHHLDKVVLKLGRQGWISTKRGRAGGFHLRLDPSEIRLGEIVRGTESFALVECLGSSGGGCRISRACTLKRVISEAREAFLGVLDRYTLADLLQPKAHLHELLAPRAHPLG